MRFDIYDYVSEKNVNEIHAWAATLQSAERGKLQQKIDMLAMHGDALYPHVLADTHIPGIKKIRVQGSVKLRPLLCNGPISVKAEYTLLVGAKEIGGRWSPKGAPEIAAARKVELAKNPASRRRNHERIAQESKR